MKGITRRIGSSLIAPLVASALAGCASGGGSKEGSDAIACLLAGPFCAFMGMGAPQKAGSGNTVAPVSNGPSNWQPPTQFTNFSAVAPQSGTYASSIGIDVTSQAAYWEGTANFSYEAQSREMGSVGPSGPALPPELAQPTGPVPAYLLRTTLSANGQPGIDVSKRFLASGYSQSSFTTLPVSGINVVGNPYALGWDYQSFGVWDQENTSGSVSGMSFGNLTPGSAIPTTGTATFNGKLGGLYMSPAGVGSVASADLKVDANFSARSLSFASTGTMTTRDFASATAMPGLNLSGTLTYSTGTNSFSGALRSASGMSGTSKGRFYGPGAQELGGVFAVRSSSTVETFTGAYGAKR